MMVVHSSVGREEVERIVTEEGYGGLLRSGWERRRSEAVVVLTHIYVNEANYR